MTAVISDRETAPLPGTGRTHASGRCTRPGYLTAALARGNSTGLPVAAPAARDAYGVTGGGSRWPIGQAASGGNRRNVPQFATISIRPSASMRRSALTTVDLATP